MYNIFFIQVSNVDSNFTPSEKYFVEVQTQTLLFLTGAGEFFVNIFFSSIVTSFHLSS